MAKLYFGESDDDKCMPLSQHIKEMEDNEVRSIIVYGAKREIGSDYMYCREFDQVGEKGNCGKWCSGYAPNNGTNGRCKHYGFTYDQTDEIKIIFNSKLKMDLNETKNLYAVRNGFKDWATFWAYQINVNATIGKIENDMNEVAELYLKQNIKK